MSSKFSASLRVPVSDSSLFPSRCGKTFYLLLFHQSLGKSPTSPSLQCLKATHNFHYAQLRYLINPKISLIITILIILPYSEPDTWEEWGELLEIMNVPAPLEGQVKSSWPRGQLPAWRWMGDHGSQFSQWTRTSSDPGLGANWEGEKSGTERAIL